MNLLADPPAIEGRRVTVMGLGRFGGGLGVARFLAARGARVLVTDLSRDVDLRGLDVASRLGEHRVEDFTRADLVVVNPAVPDDSPFLRAAADAGVPLETEINLFWKLCPSRRIVGITGSNGKTTTTALMGVALRALDAPAHVGGNIGGSLLERLDAIAPDDLVVLELSSFQLERLATLQPAPEVGVITNLVANHLDRHGTLDAYAAAKAHIVRRARTRVLNARDPGSRRYEPVGVGRLAWFDSLELPGAALRARFHRQNFAAAEQALLALGLPVDDRVRRAWTEFPGVPHRLEFVGEFGGVRWVNDSIATNPDAAIAAIDNTDGGIVLIAGGYDKKLPFDALGAAIARRVRVLVTLGPTAAAVERAAGVPALRAASFDEAVALARSAARPGETVLLSPACASYDMFRNFEERGDRFRLLARA